jgi:hypothetical protein
MGNLMAEHTCNFLFILCQNEQPGSHEDVATWDGKGIGILCLDHVKFEFKGSRTTLPHNRISYPIYEDLNGGILYPFYMLLHFKEDLLS